VVPGTTPEANEVRESPAGAPSTDDLQGAHVAPKAPEPIQATAEEPPGEDFTYAAEFQDEEGAPARDYHENTSTGPPATQEPESGEPGAFDLYRTGEPTDEGAFAPYASNADYAGDARYAGDAGDAGDAPYTDFPGEAGDAGNTHDTGDLGDAAFITGESVSLNTGDTDTGALAGRSTRAGDDPIFASLPDEAEDVPSNVTGPPVPYIPYETGDTEDRFDQPGGEPGETYETSEAGVAGAEDDPSAPADYYAPGYDAPGYDAPTFAGTAYDAADYGPAARDDADYGGVAYQTGTLGGRDVPYEATPDPAPEQAPEAVQDLASDIRRDAANAPEIVGAPVAVSIPTTSVTTLNVEDERRSRNQLLVAGVAALAVLMLCVAVILATANRGGGDGTPTAEAQLSPTGTAQVIAIATWTRDSTSVNPTTDAIPVPTGTATTPEIVPTDTVAALPTEVVAPTEVVVATEVVLPTDTALPVPTDTLPPAPTDTSVPVATDTVAPPPTDTAVPAPTNTVAPAPTDTVAPAPTDTTAPRPTNTQAPRPTNTRAPLPTSTAVIARPTATRPATASVHNIGEMVTGFNGWTVLPMWAATRTRLPSPDPEVFYQPRGVYWIVRVDVRNTLNESRSFGDTMDFVMRDANGNLHAELSNHGKAPGVREIARKEGFSYLDTVLGRGGEAATLLIYDIPRGVQPVQLVGRIRQGNGVLRDGQVVWNLNR
jgi:hypothetical protein